MNYLFLWLLLLFIFLRDIYSALYPLCTKASYPKNYCVQVDDCSNCDGVSISSVVGLIGIDGGYTILLVGSNATKLTIVESVSIAKSAPNYTTRNILKPYPGHSFDWNSGELESALSITATYWEISGDGGYLRFMNSPSQVDPIIRFIGGGVLRRLSVYSSAIKLMIKVENCNGASNKGFLMEECDVVETGYAGWIETTCTCQGNCVSDDFPETDFERRVLIRNNTIQCRNAVYGKLLFFEGNYVKSSTYSTIYLRSGASDAVNVVNNVIEITNGYQSNSVVELEYTAPTPLYGYSRFYNNHIIIRDNDCRQLISFVDNTDLPKTWYVYNNLIDSPDFCVRVGRYKYSSGTCAFNYRNNHQIRTSCDGKWGDWCGTCSPSKICEGGNNTDGTFSFEAVDPKPQYYELDEDMPYGLKNGEFSPEIEMITYDFDGNDRPGGDVLGRVSLGAFEFVCPDECLNQGYTYCQKRDCGCLGNLFGYSCQYEYDTANCPSCSPNSTCRGNFTTGTPYWCDCEEHYYGSLCDQWDCWGVPKDLNESCNSGTCVGPDDCVCGDERYTGKNCSERYCWGVLSIEKDVCSGHGNCTFPDTCKCDPNYLGLYCNTTTCYGIFSNNTLEHPCSGHGECGYYDVCECQTSYFGGLCNVTTCFEVFNNVSSVCNSRGKCFTKDECTCNDDFFGRYCNVTTCFNVFNNETNICSSHGKCEVKDKCECDTNYYGKYCNISMCHKLFSNTSESCGTHGKCQYFDHCHCDENYFGVFCNITSCFVIMTNETGVCSGHGKCDLHEKCTCFENYYGPFCNTTTCHGQFSNETECCSDHGKCEIFDSCKCETNYYGSICNITTCFGHWNNESSYCDTNGDCDAFNECRCNENYYGLYCNISTCHDIFSNYSESCGMHGICESHEKCKCDQNYFGEYCNETTCFGVWNNFTGRPYCYQHGDCKNHDKCECDQNYFGLFCNTTICYTVFSNTTNVCSSRGDCVDFNTCVCNFGGERYAGEKCQFQYCNGTLSNESSVCTSSPSRGVCVEYNQCACEPGKYSGTNCEFQYCHGKLSNESDVCTSNPSRGICVEYNTCSCQQGKYGGKQCEFQYCDGILSNESDVCTANPQRGSCVDYNSCACKPGKYGGDNCEFQYCYGVLSNESDVCSSSNSTFRGSCVEHNNCSCIPFVYGGENCQFPFCFGIQANENNSEIICSGHGNCTSPEICECDPDYYGANCSVTTCYGHFSNMTQEVCYGHGVCTEFNNCTCNSGYEHHPQMLPIQKDCSSWKCFGFWFNKTTQFGYDRENATCFGHGVCSSPDNCTCEKGYYSKNCSLWDCYFVNNKNLSDVCTGHGDCKKLDNCSCNEHYFGSKCEKWFCHGINKNNKSSVCSSHGDCVGHNTCRCVDPTKYFPTGPGGDCSLWKCDEILHNDNKVCYGHGTCTGHDTCECESGYFGKYCGKWNCSSIDKDEINFVCSGHGSCISPDNCTCKNLYSGGVCNRWSCFGVSLTKVGEVCGGHGSCVDVDECICSNEFFSMDQHCDFWRCGNYHKNASGVCGQHGICVKPHECKCHEGFVGDFCEDWTCFGFRYSSLEACSGNGRCVEKEKCQCDTGFSGEKCETNVLLIATLVPLGLIGGTCLLGLLILAVIICCCLVCCIICFLIVFFCCFFCFAVLVFCCLCFQITKLRQKNEKFGELKNFDILLQEQKMDEDTSVAHIRVNNALFEVDYDEVEIKSILGEGGSQAVVYEGLWRGLRIAFKCFKTRNICVSQDHYDEFEREVEILASVHHPHILQFLGCTMKPPRVGILMEYCSNGDVHVYIKKHVLAYEKSVPLKEKLRLCSEIASAMEYLHSRNIVHRDLKLENVLVTETVSCRVMDFGLSRMFSRMSQTKTKSIGTSLYMAPEIILSDRYDEKVDVFSFAIMLWIILTENFDPYGDMAIGLEIKVAADEDFRPKISELERSLPTDVLKWARPAVVKSWSADPEKRPSFRDLNALFKTFLSEEGDEMDEKKSEMLEKYVFEVDEADEGTERKKKKKKEKEVVEVDEKEFEELKRMKLEVLNLREENERYRNSKWLDEEF